MGTLPNHLLAFAMASLALAGCAGGQSGDPETQDVVRDEDFEDLGLKADESTGILRGIVIDQAIRPVAQATVEVLVPGEANRTMTTKDDGVFGFDKLAPGEYFLQVSAVGFLSVQASGKVEAGVANPDPVKVQLLADPTQRPYVQVEHLDGFMQCSIRPMVLGQQCGVTDEDVVNQRTFFDARPEYIQSEMVWQSTQAFGDELSLSIRCLPGDNSDPAGRCEDVDQIVIARSEGKSPQIARMNRTTLDNYSIGGPGMNPLDISLFAFGRSDLDVYDEETVDGAQEPVTGEPCMMWPILLTGNCIRATGPGIMVNQKVDVYTHIFFGYVPPEGWTFGADGDPPAPPA